MTFHASIPVGGAPTAANYEATEYHATGFDSSRTHLKQKLHSHFITSRAHHSNQSSKLND